MYKFVLQKIEEVKGKIIFCKLFIDDCCQIDEFEKGMETRYLSEARTIRSYMEYYSSNNGTKIPPRKKFKWLDVKSDYPLFEFKSEHLRYYGFKFFDGMIICTVELKDPKKQDGDIARVVSIQKEYINQQKSIQNGTRRLIEK